MIFLEICGIIFLVYVVVGCIGTVIATGPGMGSGGVGVLFLAWGWPVLLPIMIYAWFVGQWQDYRSGP